MRDLRPSPYARSRTGTLVRMGMSRAVVVATVLACSCRGEGTRPGSGATGSAETPSPSKIVSLEPIPRCAQKATFEIVPKGPESRDLSSAKLIGDHLLVQSRSNSLEIELAAYDLKARTWRAFPPRDQFALFGIGDHEVGLLDWLDVLDAKGRRVYEMVINSRSDGGVFEIGTTEEIASFSQGGLNICDDADLDGALEQGFRARNGSVRRSRGAVDRPHCAIARVVRYPTGVSTSLRQRLKPHWRARRMRHEVSDGD